MIEIFKTDVVDKEQASSLIHLLKKQFPATKINFDLQDCDKILRIDGSGYIVEDVMKTLSTEGFKCEILTS